MRANCACITSRFGPYALLFASQLAVGAAAIFARFALTGAEPVAVSAARLTIAALVLFGALLVKRGPDRAATRRENVLLAIAGVALALHFVTWIWSLQYISVAVSTLLVATTPVWTAIYDARFKNRPFTAATLAGFFIGAAGLICVVSTARTTPPIAGHTLLGALLAFSGALAIGVYFLLVREVRSSFGTRTIVTRTYAWAAFVLIAASAALRQPPPVVSDTAAWGGIVGMALISQLVGHTSLNAALRWFSPSAVAFATLLEPIFAGILAWAIFHERLGWVTLAGGALVLAAIAIVLREDTRVPELAYSG